MSDKLNITVMLGGFSAEREVSLRSGAAVAKALRSLGHEVSTLDPKDDSWTLPAKTDVVFLALHGTYGEDGAVQTHLEGLGVPFTGCGSEASRIAFDKVLTKERFLAAGLPTAKYLVLENSSTPWPQGWNPPVVLKPVCQGSSVGLQFVERVADWSASLTDAFRHDQRVLMEQQIIGRETTVGILGGQALPVVEVRPKKGAYTYANKYTVGATEYLCPAPLSPEVTQQLQQAALDAFRAVGCRDYSRIDIMVTEDGQPVILEINTLPGMTETSLLPKAAAAAGMSYEQLCQKMIDLALEKVNQTV
jgi:D-alanine-D-alanine ligase